MKIKIKQIALMILILQPLASNALEFGTKEAYCTSFINAVKLSQTQTNEYSTLIARINKLPAKFDEISRKAYAGAALAMAISEPLPDTNLTIPSLTNHDDRP